MKFKSMSLLLGAGLSLSGASLPAAAADFGYGAGFPAAKDYGSAGVPVPAPAPIPVTAADWYVRADLSYALRSTGTTATVGEFTFPADNADKMSPYIGLSVAAGRYLTPTIRGEVSLDYRTQQRFAARRGTAQGTTSTYFTSPTTGTQGGVLHNIVQQARVDQHYNINYTEEGHINNYMMLASLYYDFKNGSAFTPYLGAGVGIAMHAMHRKYTEDAMCSSQDYYFYDVAGYTGVNTTPVPHQACSATAASAGEPSGTGFGFAAAIMAGFSYEVSEGILLDTGYRFTYQNGKVTTSRDSVLGISTVDIGDRIDHEIRTGLRFDID